MYRSISAAALLLVRGLCARPCARGEDHVRQHQHAGKALIAFLATPAASAVMKSKGFTQF